MSTQRTRNLLSQALKDMPSDFSFAEVRLAIRSAITKLEHAEEKKEKKRNQTVVSNQWPVVNGQVSNPYTVKHTIDMIDEMIAGEKKKIEEIHNRKNKHNDEDEDLQTILD